jgi:hypothetical protein
MSCRRLLILAASLASSVFLCADDAAKQKKTAETKSFRAPLSPMEQSAIAEIEKRLQQRIETNHFPEDIPFAKLLAKLEELMPKDQHVALRIDEQAFGKNLAEIAATPIRIPQFPRKMSLALLLRIAQSKLTLDDVEVDYRIFPTHYAITTTKRSAYTAVHDIGDHVRHLLPKLKTMSLGQTILAEWWVPGPPIEWNDLKPGQEAAHLTRMIASLITSEPVPEVEIRNASKLFVHTSHRNHVEIEDLLWALRRLADLAVVMNARLLEVDRAFYDKHLAALFVASKDRPEGRLLARADAKLVKLLHEQKVVLAGDDLKIVPGAVTTFLSLHNLVRYPGPDRNRGHDMTQSGVAFSVKVDVSHDRQRVEVKMTQDVRELIDIKKDKMLDAKTGKDLEIDVPSIRKRSQTASIVAQDGQALVMPVGYASAAARKQGRVWVLLAAPTIWIEEEQEANRKRAQAPGSAELAKAMAALAQALPKKETPKRSEKAEMFLQGLLKEVLTNPAWNEQRPVHWDRKRFVLEDGDTIAWPAWFKGEVAGYERVSPDDLELNPYRVMKIQFGHFEVGQTNEKKIQGEAAVTVSPYVQPPVVDFAGGGIITLHLKRQGKRWSVEGQDAIGGQNKKMN